MPSEPINQPNSPPIPTHDGPPQPGPVSNGHPQAAAVAAKKTDMVTFYKVAVVVLAIIVVGLLAVMSQNQGQTAVPQATVTVTAGANQAQDQQPPERQPEAPQAAEMDPEQKAFLTDFPRRVDGDPLAKGDVDAPVVMTEWADYRCPFCSVFTEDTLPLLQPLIDDGTLRIEFRDLAIFGEDSSNAAAGARAAGEQGLYFEFATALYVSLPNEGHPPVGDDEVTAIATQVGVPDMNRFQTTYKAPGTRTAIEVDSAEAQQLGISGTPAFLVGTEFISGAQPIDVFQAVIAQQLAEQS